MNKRKAGGAPPPPPPPQVFAGDALLWFAGPGRASVLAPLVGDRGGSLQELRSLARAASLPPAAAADATPSLVLCESAASLPALRARAAGRPCQAVRPAWVRGRVPGRVAQHSPACR